MDNLTTEQMIGHAQDAFRSSDVTGAAAYASMATVELMQQFLAVAHESVGYEWTALSLPDGGHLTCICGAQVFTDYPNTKDYPLAICGIPECDALWDLAEHLPTPRLLRGGQRVAVEQRRWERNDLVRHRAARFGQGDVEVVALLQHPDSPEGSGLWAAMVLRTTENSGVIVGQALTLREGDPRNQLAQFPG